MSPEIKMTERQTEPLSSSFPLLFGFYLLVPSDWFVAQGVGWYVQPRLL
jgi:hypothetical protein